MEPRFDERMVQAIVRDLSGAPRAAWARERILAAGSHDPPLRWQRFGYDGKTYSTGNQNWEVLH